MALSCDSVYSHKAFAGSLGGISYPVLADWHPKGKVTEAYGVMNPQRGAPIRSVFVIDKNGVVRWKKVYERGLPDVKEVLAEVEKIQ
ncbi:MAG: redoxin domain-containing protein [Chloroflexi bacterium]|nr:redoxin domain-containing protein [Chloroflexota bacterium]